MARNCEVAEKPAAAARLRPWWLSWTRRSMSDVLLRRPPAIPTLPQAFMSGETHGPKQADLLTGTRDVETTEVVVVVVAVVVIIVRHSGLADVGADFQTEADRQLVSTPFSASARSTCQQHGSNRRRQC